MAANTCSGGDAEASLDIGHATEPGWGSFGRPSALAIYSCCLRCYRTMGSVTDRHESLRTPSDFTPQRGTEDRSTEDSHRRFRTEDFFAPTIQWTKIRGRWRLAIWMPRARGGPADPTGPRRAGL